MSEARLGEGRQGLEGVARHGSTPRRVIRVGLGVITALGLSVAAAPAARADDEDAEKLRRVSFSVERETEVENDRATAVLAVTGEDEDAAKLAGRVNETMAWALETARSAQDVRARSGGYQTYPVDHEGRIRRWRSRQELVLESEDLEALTRLVGELQSRLELASLGFSASPEQRRAAEDRLIAEALAAFQARAARVTESLGAAGYELVHVGLDSGGQGPFPLVRGSGDMMAMEARVAPPAVEAGTSRVVVTASGTVALR